MTAFRGNTFNQHSYAFQETQDDLLLDKVFQEARRARASERHQYRAPADVCCALTTQGIAPADLTPEALLFYASECRRLTLVVSARPDSNRFAGLGHPVRHGPLPARDAPTCGWAAARTSGATTTPRFPSVSRTLS